MPPFFFLPFSPFFLASFLQCSSFKSFVLVQTSWATSFHLFQCLFCFLLGKDQCRKPAGNVSRLSRLYQLWLINVHRATCPVNFSLLANVSLRAADRTLPKVVCELKVASLCTISLRPPANGGFVVQQRGDSSPEKRSADLSSLNTGESRFYFLCIRSITGAH